jgi:hypothetical protein
MVIGDSKWTIAIDITLPLLGQVTTYGGAFLSLFLELERGQKNGADESKLKSG